MLIDVNMGKTLVVGKKSWQKFKQNWVLLIPTILSDIFFLFLLGVGFSGFGDKIREYFTAIFVELSFDIRSFSDRMLSQGGFLQELFSAVFNSGYFGEILALLAIELIFILIVYSIFHGFSLAIVKSANYLRFRPSNFFENLQKARPFIIMYINRFMLLNLIWIVISLPFFAMFWFVNFMVGMSGYVSNNTVHLPLNGIFLVVVGYFVLISYGILPYYNSFRAFLKSFKFGTKYYKNFLFGYLAVLLFIVVINLILIWIYALSLTLYLFVGFIVVLGFLFYMRIGVFNAVEILKDEIS